MCSALLTCSHIITPFFFFNKWRNLSLKIKQLAQIHTVSKQQSQDPNPSYSCFWLANIRHCPSLYLRHSTLRGPHLTSEIIETASQAGSIHPSIFIASRTDILAHLTIPSPWCLDVLNVPVSQKPAGWIVAVMPLASSHWCPRQGQLQAPWAPELFFLLSSVGHVLRSQLNICDTCTKTRTDKGSK